MPSALVAIALLLLVPAGWAALFRRTRCPGWPVVGGLVAGLLLGPTVLGRVMPDLYERTFVGGAEEARALHRLVRAQGAEAIVAETAGVEAVHVEAMQARHQEAAAAARELYDASRWAHQRPLRLWVTAITVLVLVGSAAWRVDPALPRPRFVPALSIGTWSAALPGAFVVLSLRWFWNAGVTESALAAAAVAIGPWAVRSFDREVADLAEVGGARLVQTAGRIATIIAVGVALAATWKSLGWSGALWFASLGSFVVGWVVPVGRRGLDAVRTLLGVVGIPALTAAVAIRLDLLADFRVWPVVVLLVLSGDGRWLGAFIGTSILGGRGWLTTLRLNLGAMAAGPPQLAVTAVAVWTWQLPGTYALGLLLGAVLVEVMAPARRSLARPRVTIQP